MSFDFLKNDYFDIKLASLNQDANKKVISFSVYGSDKKYTAGTLHNIDYAKKYYPGWTCRFYCDEKVDNLEELCESDCEVLILESKIPPMFWRFFTADDPNVSAMICRDTDSLVNPREAAAVIEWLNSDKTLHLMHDCKAGHWSAVMGGMWGIKLPLDFSLIEKINNFCYKKNYKFSYSQDQTFLSKEILPIFESSCIDHNLDPNTSKYSYSVPFPKHEPLEFGSFVGQRISMIQLELSKFNSKLDAGKTFLMTHQGKKDFDKITNLIKLILSKTKSLVIPVKKNNLNTLKSNFENEIASEKLVVEEISRDIDALSLYNKSYKKTHKYLGFGTHGKNVKISNKGFHIENCESAVKLHFNELLNFDLKEDVKETKKEVIIPKSFKDYKKETTKTNTKDDLNPFLTKGKSKKVSVIIGTFNRWKYLQKAVESAKNQTYDNIEIIVINDGSTDKEYLDSIKGVVSINLPKNSGEAHGFRCRSYTYNYGLKIARGDFVAFLDDDDAWYPEKLEEQIKGMLNYKCGMSCTESLQGRGLFDNLKDYKLYMGGMPKRFKKWKVDEKLGIDLDNMPKFWNKELLSIHNFCIGSSVVLDKQILDEVGYLNESRRFKKGQDYELWKRVLSRTDCYFVNKALTYYDHGHGDGRQY